MIGNNCKMFTINVIFEIFNRPEYSKKFKFVNAISFFARF